VNHLNPSSGFSPFVLFKPYLRLLPLILRGRAGVRVYKSPG